MKVLLVDAFDSFVFIVRQYLMSMGVEPVVVRSNELGPGAVEAMRPDAILLGPGPGHPAESGHAELVNAFAERVPMLGICLGHQAIGLAFGGQVERASHLMHGKTSRIRHDGSGIFTAMPEGFTATRYHSLVVVESSLPACLEVSAWSEDDHYVMGLRHRELPIESVQFHPESVCTQEGIRLLTNFLDLHVRPRPRARVLV
ncbi:MULTISPECIES: aminodeoxychorismate/anthranilate synthase component II [unclassified Streptomyces]|uniref:anthranilate synthase component II n=1 Tax=unclassified Streptomyces TaxID=2593676 RepID=UPI0022553398|nr:aminodeoxychorismate/anthranilate synthase component II [Streptomyces sp. NBC_00338]MCX5141814.1 aminodeoxychorismate/anthranilate synthase component II [Streptomyces sp. NBC_00338]